MKGYCVDVRGFGYSKRLTTISAIDKLNGTLTKGGDRPIDVVDFVSSIEKKGRHSRHGPFRVYVYLHTEVTDEMLAHQISFNDLMLEAGFNYEEYGVEDFKCIDWSEREVIENKPTSNKTRPLITREQYDAVMAQSDKRTFTKALDDLLAIEKEHSEDDLLGDCYQGHKVNSFKVSRCASGDESSKISRLSAQVKQLERENGFLVKGINSWRESHEKMHNSKEEAEAKLEKKGRVIGFVSLLLIFSLVAQLAVIFFQ